MRTTLVKQMQWTSPAAVLLSLFLFAATVLAAPKSDPAPRSNELKKIEDAYQALRTRDPGVSSLEAWEKTASRFVTFVRKYDDEKQTPRALYFVANLYETTYRKKKFQSGLTRSVYFYEQLARGYPSHDLADDALLRMGDLRRSELNDAEGAQAAYHEILDKKGSDKYSEAMSRLQKMGVGAGLSQPHGDLPEDKPAPPAAALVPAKAEPVEVVHVDDGGKDILNKQSEINRPTIVIDPGHGGKEEGAHGFDGVLEKNLVLSISQMLDKLLRERLRARTVMTRTSDVDLSLAERTKIANDNQADLFISIHANASEYKNVSGIETYYLDNTNDKSSLKLAERENASLMQQGGGGDLGFIVSDLIQDAKTPDSVALAHHIQNSLARTLARYYREVKDLGVKKAPFYVLVGGHMPCVLVEVSFIDHPVEGKRLVTRRYQKLVASAIYDGIKAFFESR